MGTDVFSDKSLHIHVCIAFNDQELAKAVKRSPILKGRCVHSLWLSWNVAMKSELRRWCYTVSRLTLPALAGISVLYSSVRSAVVLISLFWPCGIVLCILQSCSSHCWRNLVTLHLIHFLKFSGWSPVCPFDLMLYVRNYATDLDEIWYWGSV
jgi:hypothetical protein